MSKLPSIVTPSTSIPDLHIIICGPPLVGKSTIGKELARVLQVPWIDLDAEIERLSGQTIPNLFDTIREEGFRTLETCIFKRICEHQSQQVISVGGGTLHFSGNLNVAKRHGTIVQLMAPAGVLHERLELSSQRGKRPLLEGETKELRKQRLINLLHHRGYQDIEGALDITVKKDDTILQLVNNICIELNKLTARDQSVELSKIISIHCGAHLTSVSFDNEKQLIDWLKKESRRLFICMDSTVESYHGLRVIQNLEAAEVSVFVIKIGHGEKEKSGERYLALASHILSMGITRHDLIVALGGGIVGDLCGFLAATLLRGVPWILVPTTLLSMIDSSVGGKTAINTIQGKNLIGAFYPPQWVWVDGQYLHTLSKRELAAGWAESVKHALLQGESLFSMIDIALGDSFGPHTFSCQLLADLIRVKADIVRMDLYERGQRMTLNLGHTLAHAIEATQSTLNHGEAVAIGLAFILSFSVRHWGLDAEVAQKALYLLNSAGLNTDWVPFINEKILTAMAYDKKRTVDQISIIVLPELGKAKVVSLNINDFRAMARNLRDEHG